MALVTLCAVLAWVATNLGTVGEFRYDAADLVIITGQMFGRAGNIWFLAATFAQAVAALLVLIWGATRVVRPPVTGSPVPLAATAAVMIPLVLAMSFGWGDAAANLWGVPGILLLVLYVAAAHANSRLDDSTIAWAVFASMAIALVVVVFLHGASEGWWPTGIAAAIVVTAAAWALNSRRLSRENRAPR